MKSVRNYILVALLSLLFVSCQSSSLGGGSDKSKSDATANGKSRHDIIKEEKRKQSEADLPFRGLDPSKKIDTIAFGSSLDQNQPQTLLTTIGKNNPDLFIFTGDHLNISKADQKNLTEQYRKLNRIAEYRDMREKTPVMIAWEDQDYAANAGTGPFIDRDSAKADFIKYWAYLKTTLNGKQKALYHSKILGAKKQTVQIIILDTTSDRSELKKNTDLQTETAITTTTVSSTDPTTATTTTTSETKTVTVKENKPFVEDTDKKKKFLSEEQWSWLESELRKPAAFRVLVSSIQVIANDHQFEKWGLFPHERERLLNLIKYTKAKNLVILSGNRQIGSIAQTEIKGLGKIYDVTSSPMNLMASQGNVLKDASYTKEAYAEVNFGLIKIDWASRKATVELHAADNSVVNSADIKF